ncbi:hypothetical protein Naga_100242g3 [Nannochloropsis gaditana]|uniref:Uncharacterized protein n=1 Tax=Nannochloropsis gaditana TaxID=72520 RepID=W7UCY8_9STRA|nr:hypothetical protein Naga_100242g3 [Nannochloropsis gaditana]
MVNRPLKRGVRDASCALAALSSAAAIHKHHHSKRSPVHTPRALTPSSSSSASGEGKGFAPSSQPARPSPRQQEGGHAKKEGRFTSGSTPGTILPTSQPPPPSPTHPSDNQASSLPTRLPLLPALTREGSSDSVRSDSGPRLPPTLALQNSSSAYPFPPSLLPSLSKASGAADEWRRRLTIEERMEVRGRLKTAYLHHVQEGDVEGLLEVGRREGGGGRRVSRGRAGSRERGGGREGMEGNADHVMRGLAPSVSPSL